MIGVGLSDLSAEAGASGATDLFDPGAGARAAAERAMDDVRRRFGADAVMKGRALK